MNLSYLPKTAAAALALTPLLAVAACGSGSNAGAPSASPSASPSRSPLQQRASLATATSFSGTYAVADTTHTSAVARVWVMPHAYRVEVVEGGATAALYGTPSGTVACPEQAGKPTVCYTVAAAGKPVPAAYDAGIERVFTRDLPALAAGAPTIRVTSAAVPAAAKGADCWAVTAPKTGAAPVDSGTYCLDADGAPVFLKFATGTLTLTKRGPATTAADLKLPAPPRALPTKS